MLAAGYRDSALGVPRLGSASADGGVGQSGQCRPHGREAVLWETEAGGVYRGAMITHRWGEFFDGFEHRSFDPTPPAVTARVIFRGGPMRTLRAGSEMP